MVRFLRLQIQYPQFAYTGFLTCLLLLAQCNGGSGGGNTSAYPGRINPSPGQWTAYGTGAGITAQLSNPFIIPTESSGQTINYVYTAPGSLVVGKTIALNYSVSGNAKFAPLPETTCGASCGPALIRLFIWGNISDTASDRWWCNANAKPLAIGSNQVISCVIDTTWTGTGLPGQNPAGFTQSLANPFAIGLTFGGMFAGHGDWATSGSATFTVNSLTVQ